MHPLLESAGGAALDDEFPASDDDSRAILLMLVITKEGEREQGRVRAEIEEQDPEAVRANGSREPMKAAICIACDSHDHRLSSPAAAAASLSPDLLLHCELLPAALLGCCTHSPVTHSLTHSAAAHSHAFTCTHTRTFTLTFTFTSLDARSHSPLQEADGVPEPPVASATAAKDSTTCAELHVCILSQLQQLLLSR